MNRSRGAAALRGEAGVGGGETLPDRFPHADRVPAWREDTPGCGERAHLNNAGAALMPRQVTEAITDHIALEARIGGYEAADERAEAIEETYALLGRLVGAQPRNMAIASSATMAFTQAISSLDPGPGDTLVTTRCDYTSNQIQYLSLARRRGVRVIHAPDLPGGGVDPQAVRQILRREPRVRFVAASWIPTNSGLVQDVHGLGEVCEEAGVPFVVDACQAVGQLPIDVAAIRCDYLSATGRKFLRGPRGTGFLYASDRALARGEHPLLIDMRGARWTEEDSFAVDPTARRHEEWELPYALVRGLSEAARYALVVGASVARERAFALGRYARERLAALAGVRTLDRGHDPCAIVTATIGDLDATLASEELRRRGINTSPSLGWVGLLDFAEKGVSSALRVSPHYYNTAEEVDVLVGAIEELMAG